MDVQLDKLNILVVEDNPKTRKLIEAVLRDMRVGQVFTANDGREAQTFLETGNGLINLIICDWNMPRMSGIELLKLVRNDYPNIPFLMVTARGTIDSVLTAKQSGVAAYIVKPFSPAMLEEKVVTLARRVR